GAFGGLRTGEMLALRRNDVDPLHGIVNVKRQSQRVAGRGLMVTPPKSEAAVRSVTLPRTIVEELEQHLGLYVGTSSDSLLFTSSRGAPVRRATLAAAWHEACRIVGIEAVRIHDLRHFAAISMARMPGIATKEIMQRIGHSNPQAALRYQHATQVRDADIASYLDAQLADDRAGE
ncbi:phage integrase family protein, partial [mine drainage metagenome]